MEEQISKIYKKLEVIETILGAYAASGQSWDEYRRGKSGYFHVYSLEQLLEEKRQLNEQLIEERGNCRKREFIVSKNSFISR